MSGSTSDNIKVKRNKIFFWFCSVFGGSWFLITFTVNESSEAYHERIKEKIKKK